jgi:hypothetical protein
MKREEAIAVLREISGCCQNLSPDSIFLVKAQVDDRLLVGYQLHIKMALDPITVEQIQAIASKNCLAVYEEKGEGIIIYKPKTIPA